MRYWYVSYLVLMAFVLQVVLLAEARAAEDIALANTQALNSSQPAAETVPDVQASLTASTEEAAEPAAVPVADPAVGPVADAGAGSAAHAAADAAAPNAEPSEAGFPDAGSSDADTANMDVEGASVENPFARFDILALVAGKWSRKEADGSGQTSAEPDYSRWRCLYQSIEELPEGQRQKASAIVTDSLPKLNEIDTKISGTVGELQALTYSDNADPEELPRLGLDLQRLREELRATLAAVNIRLQKEAGLRLSEPRGRGCESMRIYPAGAFKSVNLPQ